MKKAFLFITLSAVFIGALVSSCVITTSNKKNNDTEEDMTTEKTNPDDSENLDIPDDSDTPIVPDKDTIIKPFATPETPIENKVEDFAINLSKLIFWETDNGSGVKCGTYNPETKILELNTQWKAGAVYAWNFAGAATFDASDYRYIRIDYEPVDNGGPTNQKFRIRCIYGDGTEEIQLCERKRHTQYCTLDPELKKEIKQVEIWCITEQPIAYKIKGMWFTQDKIISPAIEDKKDGTFDNNITAISLVKDMGVGWNLGNTFDAHSFGWQPEYWKQGIEAEFHWEDTETTYELLKFPYDNGYKTLRVPVTWYCHIIDDKYTIDPDWMARVKRVVDMALDIGYYVILNEHHSVHGDHVTVFRTTTGQEHLYDKRRMPSPLGYADGYIVSSNQQDIEESERFLKAIWTQIAAAFNGSYNEKLIFETMNEPRNPRDEHPATYNDSTNHEWQPGLKLPYHKKDGKTIGGYWCDNRECEECKAEYEVLNRYNQVCLDAIRASGGNNAKRFVMIPGLCTNTRTVLPKVEDDENGIYAPGLFKMPEDISENAANNKLIVTVHEYPGWKQNEGNSVFAPRMQTEISENLRLLNEAFVNGANGDIPVVIGETGTGRQSISYEERVKWIKFLMEHARKYGMSVIWWDCGSDEDAFAQINREKICFYEPDFVAEMMKAYYETPSLH